MWRPNGSGLGSGPNTVTLTRARPRTRLAGLLQDSGTKTFSWSQMTYSNGTGFTESPVGTFLGPRTRNLAHISWRIPLKFSFKVFIACHSAEHSHPSFQDELFPDRDILSPTHSIGGRVSAAIGPTAELQIGNANVAPDGFTRTASLANGGVPGPLITGNKGDTFSIDVQNQLDDQSLDVVTSIHWHGIFQTNTNYADGGAFVNQCPIVPDNDFTYVFQTLDQAGTFWYHSHYQAQYCDGVRGVLVIYDPNDPQADLYDVDDEDTVITLADWYHFSSLEVPQIPEPNSTLINGIGRYSGGPKVDLAVVNVEFGKRYRLRLVSISCDPNFNFSIDSHQMTIIEVDGENHQPLVVDSLQIFAGQRYSVVLNANKIIGNYWIRAVPNLGNQNFTGLTNLAILRYSGALPINPLVDPTRNIPKGVLPLKETDLHPLDPTPVPGNPVPGGADINIDLNVGLSADFTQFLVNGVAYESPDVPVLLQILNGVPASQLLPNGSIYTLGANQSVEITFPSGAGGINTGGPHPLHLHGHVFHVVRSAGNSTYNFDNPVMRDVVNVGNTDDEVTIRFQTDNPGPWFLHCHIDWHLEKGFAVVMAEDVPAVPTDVIPPDSWNALCTNYTTYVDANPNITLK